MWNEPKGQQSRGASPKGDSPSFLGTLCPRTPNLKQHQLRPFTPKNLMLAPAFKLGRRCQTSIHSSHPSPPRQNEPASRRKRMFSRYRSPTRRWAGCLCWCQALWFAPAQATPSFPPTPHGLGLYGPRRRADWANEPQIRQRLAFGFCGVFCPQHLGEASRWAHGVP